MTKEQTHLWKQILGAGVGAALAIVAYGGYELVAPALRASMLAGAGSQTHPSRGIEERDADLVKALKERAAGEKEVVMQTGDVMLQNRVVMRRAERLAFHGAAQEQAVTFGASVAQAAQPTSEALLSKEPVPSTLPDSGPGIVFGGIFALGAAAFLQKRKLIALFCRPSTGLPVGKAGSRKRVSLYH